MGFDPWTIVAEFAIGIGIAELQKWMTLPPGALRDHRLDAPTTQEGSPLPMIYGQVRVRNALIPWYGGATSFAGSDLITESIWIRDPPATVYATNLLFVLGVPAGPPSTVAKSVLFGMYVGDTKLKLALSHLAFTSTDAFQSAQVSFPSSLSPVDQVGTIQFLAGASDQRVSDNVPKVFNPVASNDWSKDLTFAGRFMSLRSVQVGITSGPNIDVTLIPGFRNQLMVSLTGNPLYPLATPDVVAPFLTGYVVGGDPQLPSFSFEVRSTYQRYRSVDLLSGDADPVAVIYDILTNPWAKMNLSSALIDDASFAAASAILYAEGHGYSMVIDSARDAKSILQDIVNQIAGVLYQDPYTGLITLKLIRGGYNPLTLPSFTPSNVLRFDDYDPGTWLNVNEVRVHYTSRLYNYAPATTRAQNQASAVFQDAATDAGNPGGKIRVVDVQYPGVTTEALASTLAARDLNLLSQPLAKGKLVVNRTGHTIRPGDCFLLTFPDYGINAMVCRALNVDLGTLEKGEVSIDFVQDLYVSDAAGYVTPPTTQVSLYAEPLTKRKVTEAPYWLMYQDWQEGGISTPDVQRLLSLATPDDGAATFAAASSDGATGFQLESETGFPLSARVHAAYGRELDPYDTSTGLVLDTLTNGQTPASLAAATFSPIGVHANGSSLILVGDEIMAYESATDLGSGLVRLNNVWRGLLDTATRDHAIGERVFWIGTSFFGVAHVGSRGWAQIGGVKVKETPRISVRDDGGANNVDTINIQGRGNQPARVADLVLCGEVMAGTQGIPAVAAPAGQLGTFKKVTSLEEGFGYAFKKRDRKLVSISRGDDADETPSDTDPTTWDVFAQKVRSGYSPSIAAADAEVAIRTGLTAANLSDAAPSGAAGYGDIDVIAHTRRTKPAGGGGILASVTYSEWDPPKVRVRAERWRSLITNARFDFHGAGTNPSPGWTNTGIAPTIGASTKSITRAATDCYAGGTVTAGTPTTLIETFDVSGYLPRGMTARLEFYARLLVAGADTVTAIVSALDASNSVLATTTITGGAITPASSTYWTRYSGTVVCPALTTQIKVSFATSGSANAAITEVCVRLGHAPQYDVLSNGSFDNLVTFTGWTNDTNSMVQGLAIISPSQAYAQGGAFATSVIHQDYAIPAGYEVGGTAVLNLWRAQTLVNDSGDVDLEVLDGSNVIIANQRTGAETLAVLNQWYKRRLSVDLPAGAVKLRVKLTANRSLGSGNSGACFDEVTLELHKDLGDPRYYRALTFDTPTVQPVVTTWQDWHLAYARSLFDLGIKDPDVICGYEPSLQNAANGFGLMWSDHIGSGFSGRAQQPLYGNFGGGVASMPAFRFTRQSGAGALDLKSDNEGNGKFACPSATSPFTAIAFIRVDEVGFATACGIAGRTGASSGSPGWGLEINAAGEAVGTLWGASATKSTSNAGAKVTDGALHMVGMAYDPIANTLTVVDEAHSTSISTVGMGEILNTTDSVVFRLGRSRDSIDTIPGMIGTVLRFDAALTAAQMQAHWTYAKDPTGAGVVIVAANTSWIAGTPNSAGATLVKVAGNQFPIGYTTSLTTDGGTGYGLALAKGSTNIVPSFDFTGGTYVADGGVTLTQGITDATGRPLGVTVVSPSTSAGFKMIGLSMSATATLQLQFLARAAAGTPTLNVELQNASNVVKQTLGVVLSTQWKLYTVSFTLWDNSTPTARLRFISASGSTQFDLSSVMWAAQGTALPPCWPDALATIADANYLLTETQLAQANAEGEVVATGVAMRVTPSLSTLVDVSQATNNKNARELLSDGTGKGELDHYDSVTPTNVTSKSTAFDWSQIWKVRGRWCSIGTLDNAATPFAGVVATASVSSAVYGRSAAWTYDATLNTRIRIGKGVSGNSPLDCFVRSVVVRAREEKLV